MIKLPTRLQRYHRMSYRNTASFLYLLAVSVPAALAAATPAALLHAASKQGLTWIHVLVAIIIPIPIAVHVT
jgi:hypothetical protein